MLHTRLSYCTCAFIDHIVILTDNEETINGIVPFCVTLLIYNTPHRKYETLELHSVLFIAMSDTHLLKTSTLDYEV